MATNTTRTTIYLDPALHQALRLKATAARRTMSDVVNDALRAALREDEADLAAFTERETETSLSYAEFLSRLRDTRADRLRN